MLIRKVWLSYLTLGAGEGGFEGSGSGGRGLCGGLRRLWEVVRRGRTLTVGR